MSKLSKAISLVFGTMKLDNNFKDYDEYWDVRGFHAPSLPRAKILTKFIDNKSTLLDIGCGDGTVIEYLSKHNKLKDAQGIDISKSAVKYVRKRGFKATVIDVTSTEFKKFLEKKKFDYIVITEVLEHIQDPETVMTLLHGHFNKSVFVSIPNSGYFLHRLRLMFGLFPQVAIQQHTKEHIRFWTVRDFIYWSKYHGYKVDKILVSFGLGIKPLAFLENLMPGLFGLGVIYKLSKIESAKNS